MDQEESRPSGSAGPDGFQRSNERFHVLPDLMQRDITPETARSMEIYDALTTAAMGRQVANAFEDNSGVWHDYYDKDRRAASSDDPSLHDGRIRGSPHVEGNFPSFAQIIWRPDLGSSTVLDAIVQRAFGTLVNPQAQITNLVRSMGIWQTLHISLSQNLQLNRADRQLFLDTVEIEIKATRLKPFEISFDGVKWFSDTKVNPAQHYLCLSVAEVHGTKLNTLLWAVNKAALKFRQGLLYYDALMPCIDSFDVSNLPKLCCAQNFHVSLARSDSPPNRGVDVEQFVDLKSQGQSEAINITHFSMQVTHVRVDIGQSVHDIPLASDIIETVNKPKTSLFSFS